MNLSAFLKHLGITVLILAISLSVLHSFPDFYSYVDLSIIGAAFFIVLSLAVFFAGNLASRAKNKQLYTQLIVFNFMIKLAASLLILIAYQKINSPENNLFIIPFIYIYLVFTVFETYLMIKQSKNRNQST